MKVLKGFKFLCLFMVISAYGVNAAGIRETEIRCLAKNIYHEARGESKLGRIAVANVTMNRLNSREFPNTVCGVVNQRTRAGCQFSWVCARNKRIRDIARFNSILNLATSVYDGRTPDTTSGATHFHAVHIKPNWAKQYRKTVRIGNHIFYRRR